MRTVDGRPVLRFERALRHGPDKVWRAVTEPGEMSRWFPATVHAEPAAGATMRFEFDASDATAYTEGEVLEYDPPKVYAFRWADSVLRFELLPHGDGCLLVFTHTLPGTGTHGDVRATARQASGWDGCLWLLAANLDGDADAELTGNWWFERAERYVEEFGLGVGELVERGDELVVRFERDLVQPVDEVWQTLTAADEELAVGAAPPVQLTHGYVTTGAVTAVSPPHTVEYAWLHDGAPAGTVTFHCGTQEPLGTRLVVTQTVPARLRDLCPTMLAAWHTHLELLFAALHGDVRCPWPAERTEQLRQQYTARRDVDAVKNDQRTNWDGASAGWEATQDDFERGAASATARLFELAGLRAGQRVLDIATGPGEPALSAARIVGPHGHVIGTDIAPGMLDVARRRAAGLDNVEFVQADVEGLDVLTERFDVVLSRFGLIFATDHVGMFRGVAARLVPGGVLAAAVWAPQEKHMLSTGPLAVTEHLQLPPPDPGVPNQFSMADADELRAEVAAAGFTDVSVVEHVLPFTFPDVAAYVRFNKLALPPSMVQTARDRLGDAELDRLLSESVAHLVADDGSLYLPSTALLVRGVREGDDRA